MTDSVAEIQLHAQSGIEFIRCNNIALQLHTTGDDGFTVKVDTGFTQGIEQGFVIQDSVFDDLSASVPENVFRKCIQCIRITQNKTGLVKGTNQIFTCR